MKGEAAEAYFRSACALRSGLAMLVAAGLAFLPPKKPVALTQSPRPRA